MGPGASTFLSLEYFVFDGVIAAYKQQGILEIFLLVDNMADWVQQ